jgi:hypothetical protein
MTVAGPWPSVPSSRRAGGPTVQQGRESVVRPGGASGLEPPLAPRCCRGQRELSRPPASSPSRAGARDVQASIVLAGAPLTTVIDAPALAVRKARARDGRLPRSSSRAWATPPSRKHDLLHGRRVRGIEPPLVAGRAAAVVARQCRRRAPPSGGIENGQGGHGILLPSARRTEHAALPALARLSRRPRSRFAPAQRKPRGSLTRRPTLVQRKRWAGASPEARSSRYVEAPRGRPQVGCRASVCVLRGCSRIGMCSAASRTSTFRRPPEPMDFAV